MMVCGTVFAAWEKTETLTVGDVVVMAVDNSNVTKELTAVTTSGTTIGTATDYTGTPAGTYPLTIVAGSAEGSIAFKTTANTYLSWKSGNSLTTAESVEAASSWTVSFSDGLATVTNVGTTARILQYNSGSPRFACYTSAQTKLTFWKQVAGDVVVKPTLTASASFLESIEVTMSAADGAVIYYTTDGTDPTTASSVYSSALTITETTTVKAIAVLDEKSSDIAEATYTKLVKNTIAEAQAAEAGTSVFVEGTVVASAASGAVIYDGTDYLYYYNTNNELLVGQKVRMIGTLASYGGAKQLPAATEVTVLDTEDVVHPAAVALDGAALDAIKTAGVVTRQYASMIGVFSISSGKYFNVAVDGTTEAVGAIVKPNEDLSALDGETVKVTGYVMYVNSKYVYFVATSVEKVKSALEGADFEAAAESNAIGIRTYNKDITGEEVAEMQSVEGWTIVENGDARAAGIFAYGSESYLGGAGYVAPAAKYAFAEEAAKALGMVAVWTASLQYTQDVYLVPGKYMLQVPVYNAGGAGAVASNLIGAAGTFATETKYPEGQWTVSNVEFTVEAAQTVTVSLGYKAANAGSGSMPHIFIESATLVSGEEAIAAAKDAAATRCATLNAAIALDKAKAEKLALIDALFIGEALFQYSQTAIDDAKAAVNGATTVDEVAAVAMPTPILPDAEKQYSLKLKDAETYMAINEGIKLSNGAYPFTFEAVEGGYALKNGENYVAFTGTGDNTWSMGATTAPYAWAVTALADGYYTLAKVSNAAHMIGVDDATAGSSCFANKNGDKAMWSIAEYVAPSYTVTIADGIENGAVVVDPTSANEGTTVKLTITPAEGYVLDALTVMNGEDPVEVAEDNTFVMPAGNVVVSATFKEESPKNITNTYLVNADLSTIDSGWTYYSDAYKYQGWRNANNETVIPGVEFYAGWGSLEHTNFKFSQNVTLPAGDYRIVVNAFFREGAAGNGTNADKAWIFAGEKKQNVYGLNSGELDAYSSAGDDMNRALAAFKAGKFENAFDFSLAEETAIDLGFEGKFDDLKQWCILGPVKLYKYSLEDYLVAYREKVAEAEALYDSKMGSTELEALKATVKEESTFSLGSEVAAAITAMNDAITAAKASIAGYAELGEALTKGETYKANSSDEEAKTAYSTAVEAIQTAYEAGTVADLAAALATVQEALPALAKTQTADNSDLTAFIVNSTVNGADGWTIERPNGGNGPLLNNASFEYWAGNASSRDEAEFDYYQVIENLPNGFYTISAEMYNSLNGEDGAVFAATSGVYAAAGEAEVSKLVDVDGTEFIKYTTDKIAVTNGTLRIGVKNTVKPMAARWFVADNFKLTLVHAFNDTELAYNAAIASIKDGNSYRVFTQVGENKFYLDNKGYLVANVEDATSFKFTKASKSGTLYETGWNLGCKFTNPSLAGGSTGDVVQNGHIIVGSNDRDDWERQVFFLNAEGKYAVRATNANSANWGANTYWTVTDTESELPKADYSLDMSYVWQIEESAPELRPDAFAKTRTWAADMQNLYGLVTEGSQWTSNAKDPNEGSYAALVDGDYTTFFHSSWRDSAPDEDHYLQVELSEPVQDFYFYMKKRSQNNNNRPTDIAITASNDGETFADVTEITEGLPTGAAPVDYLSNKVSMDQTYKTVRFTVKATSTGQTSGADGKKHVYFTASEWYILPSNELTDAALKYASMKEYTEMTAEDVPVVNALAEQIAAAVADKALADDIAALGAEVDRLLAIVDATDSYTETVEGIAASTRTALETAKEATYTTAEEIATVKAGLVDIIKPFFAGIKAVKPIDVTEYYIVNPNPVKDKAVADGWEGDTFGDASNGVSEYWNKSAAGFHQTISLPAGDYKLTVVALQRTNMQGVVYAGEEKTTIAQVASTVVNSRSQAANWFAQGNGKNEVYFTVAEDGDVKIGLTTDKDNGDHWTVWQSFKLEKIAPFFAINVAETENGKVVADHAKTCAGETVTVTVTPDDGYMVDEAYWSYMGGDGVEQKNEIAEPEEGNAASFVMPAANVTITVTFKAIAPTTYAINIEEAENGKVESDKATAAEGETVTLTATPAEGYIPDDITITYGENQKVEPVINEETLTATFVMPAGDVTIVMTFKEESGTGINGIAADQKEVIFDMNGRRVSRTAKGVLIVNGKKVVRK